MFFRAVLFCLSISVAATPVIGAGNDSVDLVGDGSMSIAVGDLDQLTILERLMQPSENEFIEYSDSCCKRCSKGKACGDSCINRNYQCRKGIGCACDN